MMNGLMRGGGRFFRVIWSRQAYLNLIYLLAAGPLGLLYFILLVTGLSMGVSLAVVWVGIPVLLAVAAGWWVLASFERSMAIHCLKEEIPAMRGAPPPASEGLWGILRGYLTNPVTWKSPAFLLLKFPLGVATFSTLAVLLALTLALLTLPLTYRRIDVQFGGFFSPGQAAWQIDGTLEAMLGTLIGLVLWPASLWIVNGLAWLHARFARAMLSIDPWTIKPGTLT